MRKIAIGFFLIGLAFVFTHCSSTKKAQKGIMAVTYENNISGIIQANCGPCHLSGKGNKKPLDNFASASKSIDDIVARIQKNPGEHGFMPAMHAKLPDSTIQVFVQWKNSGLKEN